MEKLPFNSTLSRLSFAVCILCLLYLFYLLVKPFLVPIFLAVVLTVVCQPLYGVILQIVGGRRTLASAFCCFLIIVIIVVPFVFIAGLITNQALELYNQVSLLMREGSLISLDQLPLWQQINGWIQDNLELLGLANAFDFSQEDFVGYAGELVRSLSTWLYDNLTGFLRSVTNLIISFAMLLFVAFYLFIDGPAMSQRLISLSPLPDNTNRSICEDIISSLRTTLKGTVVLAFAQGVANGIGFWVVGVPHALFWGAVMVIASVVPLVGTALIWLPASIYLVFVGDVQAAIMAAVWCTVAGLICDNILRPKLLGGHNAIHPLLTFFSVLGGLTVFGMVGLILGPLILAILISLLDIYRHYFLNNTFPDCPPTNTGDDVKPS